MRGFLINAGATALMVCVATVASITLGAVLVMFVLTPQGEMPADPSIAGLAGVVGGMMAAVVGVFFCAVTLFWAALTMPPTLWVIRKFDLPRPSMDMIGGAMMGLFCAMMGSELFSDIKGSDVIPATGDQVLAVVGLLTGCALGYIRHALLVRGRVAPQAALA